MRRYSFEEMDRTFEQMRGSMWEDWSDRVALPDGEVGINPSLDTDDEEIGVTYRNGVLEVRLPIRKEGSDDGSRIDID